MSFRIGVCLVVALSSIACARVPECPHAVAVAADGCHIAVHAEAGRIWWSYQRWSEPHQLWALPARGAVSNLDVRPVRTFGVYQERYVVSFEQGGARWMGWLGDDRNTISPLVDMSDQKLAEAGP